MFFVNHNLQLIRNHENELSVRNLASKVRKKKLHSYQTHFYFNNETSMNRYNIMWVKL